MSAVASPLPGSPLGVSGRVLHAPDLDVPAVSQEVGAASPVPRQDRLDAVRDAVLAQPIADAPLVGRAQAVTVRAGEALTSVPAVTPDINSKGLKASADERATDADLTRQLRKAVAALVATDEFWARWPQGLLAGSPCFPDRRASHSEFLTPVKHGAPVNPVLPRDAVVPEMLDVQHPLQITRSRRFYAPIGEPPACSPSRDVELREPAAHRDLVNAVDRGDVARRQEVVKVKLAECFAIRSHPLILSVEYGTLRGLR